jgi:uncharacterized protein YggL (DUF469 family)
MTTVRNRHFKKKRLRKKYHQGEFQQLGFEFDAQWADTFTDTKYDNACNVIVDCVEKLKLECGGSFGPNGVSLFVCKHKGSCTMDDILMFTNLVSETGFVKNIMISNLVDVWYDY